MNCWNCVKTVLSVSLLLRGLGDPEIDHLGHRHAIVQRHEDVRGLNITVDNALSGARAGSPGKRG
jgi:hypothetical protein